MKNKIILFIIIFIGLVFTSILGIPKIENAKADTNDNTYSNIIYNSLIVGIKQESPYIELKEVSVLSNSSAKTYEALSGITAKNSAQWEYLSTLSDIEIIHKNGKDRLYTKNPSGYVISNDGYYGVALGSYFGSIGSKYVFELDTGIVLKLVKVDSKADNHTDKNNFAALDGSVIEFVVDTTKMQSLKWNNGYIYGGNFNNCPYFEGKIKNIWEVTELE